MGDRGYSDFMRRFGHSFVYRYFGRAYFGA
jgi:hypothetical protein